MLYQTGFVSYNTPNVIEFDDYTDDEDNVWSQICNDCKQQLDFDYAKLSDGGSGICGVKGCNNEADYYIDFKENQILRKGEYF